MTTKQIRIGTDCIEILDKWRCPPEESHSDAIRRMNRRLEKLEKLEKGDKK